MTSVNRKDLQALSRVRLIEAKTLLRAGLPDGAYYLAGYSIECALKACIAKQTVRYDFPDKKKANDSYTHDLKALVNLAALESARVAQSRASEDFRQHWDVVLLWSEDSRYRRRSTRQAELLMQAIESRKDGIMQWLRRYW